MYFCIPFVRFCSPVFVVGFTGSLWLEHIGGRPLNRQYGRPFKHMRVADTKENVHVHYKVRHYYSYCVVTESLQRTNAQCGFAATRVVAIGIFFVR